MALPGPNDNPITMGGEEGMPVSGPPPPARKQKKKKIVPEITKTDDFIMDTNNSSIVSKRSVEKLYYPGQKEYFRYFVRKFQRRSPLINRGYWLRMKAVDSVVRKFLSGNPGTKKIVVNLGCGYDPNPFEYLGRQPELCEDVTFVDVDYPPLMHKKYEMITSNPPLLDLIPDLQLQPAGSAVIARAEKYLAVGCDLRELEKLESVLRTEFDMANTPVSILFTAEVSVAYMTMEASNAVYKWASKFDDVRFCLLEQQIPDGRDHPFARTMLKHFEKLRTPLHAVGTVEQMHKRFSDAGWPAEGVNIRSLWELWADPEFLTSEQRMDLDKIEPFDEWEEFALFGSHYFLLDAIKTKSMSSDDSTPSAHNSESVQPDVKGADSDASSPESATPDKIYHCVPLSGKPSYRRFAAALPSNENTTSLDKIALHGGLGVRERLYNCDTYTINDNTSELTPPPLPTGIMCHTITPINKGDCLLVGGRTSPDKASASCWYRKDGTWTKVHDLPEGRYRHCAIALEGFTDKASGVVVFGGRNSRGEVLNDCLLWQPTTGWTQLESVTSDLQKCLLEPRFGAAMTLLYAQAERGYLTGGLRRDGTIIDDFWVFELRVIKDSIVVILENCTKQMREALPGNEQWLGRFGAALVPTPTSLLLLGGVAADKLLDRKHEILDLEGRKFIEITSDHRPLLTGFTALSLGNESSDATGDVIVLGGGATCFSFGTYWNDGCVLHLGTQEGEEVAKWRILLSEDVAQHGKAKATNGHFELPSDLKREDLPKFPEVASKHIEIPRKSIETAADFELVRNEGRPVILSGTNLGACTELWTNDYLKAQIGESRDVVVHSAPTPHMNFQKKNFSYTTQPFGSFLDAASNGGHLYLRALSTEKPSDKPTNLTEDFPSIAGDFQIPPALQYVQDNMHSSPFRISGPVTMWLHYDVMANVLCQIRGHKRLLLFSPTEVTKLSFPAGASSSTINPFTDAHSAQAYEAQLQPGDVLFIPPMWLHAAEPTEGLSVAVNVFFRDSSMQAGYAAGRDVYGNRDLAAYERGRRDVQRIAKGFEGLSGDVRKFYLSRLAKELGDLA